MAEEKDIAIVIPCFRSQNTIAQTLSSLQAIDVGWERVAQVLLCDDCSDDETATVVASTKFTRAPLEMVMRANNGGEPAALNSMIRELHDSVKFFLILHGDDLALPIFLSRNIELIERFEGRFASISSNFYNFTESTCALSHQPATDEVVFRANSPDDLRHTALVGTWWHVSGALVNRSAWVAVGGADSRFRFAADLDLLGRWQIAGLRVGHSLIPTTKYRLHDGSITSRSYRTFLDLRDRIDIAISNDKLYSPSIRSHLAFNILRATIRRMVSLACKGNTSSSLRWGMITLAKIPALMLHRFG